MLTPVIFFIPLSSRDLFAAAGVDLTTYGLVGTTTGHMTGAGGGGGGMSEAVMNT